MSLPFFKADTDGYLEAMSAMEWKTTPPRSQMHTEVKAVVAGDVIKRWSISRWARRWRCSRNLVRAVLSEVAEWQDDWGGEEWVESRRALFFARYLPPKEAAKTVKKAPEEAQDEDTPGTPQGQRKDTPGTPQGQGEPDANNIVDEHGTPQGQGKDTPGTGSGHPKDTIARVSSETGDRRRSSDSPKPPQPSAEGALSPEQVQLSLVTEKPPARVLEETLGSLGVKLPSTVKAQLVQRGWVTAEALAALPPTRAAAGQGHLALVSGMGKRTRERLRDALRRAGHDLTEDAPKETATQDPRWRLVTDLFKEVFLANGLGERVVWEPHRQMTALAVQIADVAGVSKVEPADGLRRCRMAFEAYLGDLQAPENWPHEPTLTGFANPKRITGRFTGRATPRAPAGRRGPVNLSALYHGLDDEPATDPTFTTWS